jgi:prepilin-type processing-associated H-X9-DG protein
MSSLDLDQQELIFDHCIGLSDPSDAAKAEELISHNMQAAELCDAIKEALAPLAYLPPELCPDDLADRTVQRLSELAGHRLVEEEPGPRAIRLGFPRHLSNTARVVVMAASVVLVIGVVMRSSGLMRQRFHNQVCRTQLSDIYRALDLYTADYDDVLPVVARADGALWHRIGDQDPQNGSNTRPLFLLLAHRYTETPEDFICCSRGHTDVPRLKRADIPTYRDFPSRSHITYSYQLMPHPRVSKTAFGARPLMADMNPHFESLLSPATRSLPLTFDKKSVSLNSVNHGRQGQNVLFGDGHARHTRTRLVGDSRDDIYTMDEGAVGGCKRLPSSLDDAFLAP